MEKRDPRCARFGNDVATLALWREAVTPPKGTNQHSDNVTMLDSDRGNTRSTRLDDEKGVATTDTLGGPQEMSVVFMSGTPRADPDARRLTVH